MRRDTARMRDYWEERARLNPAFYVDTSLDYDAPDMARFLANGRRVVSVALDEPPAVRPSGWGTAVEIGCGLGRVCLALSERFDRVVGLDISAEMLRRARELVPEERVELRRNDGASLDGVADSSVDLVLTFTVFQHIPSLDVIRGYVAEAGRVLRPGGVFVLQWNSTAGAWRWRIRRGLLALVDRLGRADRYGRDAPEFVGSRVELATMRRLLTDAGLDVAAVTGQGTLFTWAWAVKPSAAAG